MIRPMSARFRHNLGCAENGILTVSRIRRERRGARQARDPAFDAGGLLASAEAARAQNEGGARHQRQSANRTRA